MFFVSCNSRSGRRSTSKSDFGLWKVDVVSYDDEYPNVYKTYYVRGTELKARTLGDSISAGIESLVEFDSIVVFTEKVDKVY